MKPFHRDIVLMLRELGATDIQIDLDRSHPRLTFRFDGMVIERVISCTPSDSHAINVVERDIRRALKIEPPRKRDSSRPRRRRNKVMVIECPRLSALPDWRDKLPHVG